MAEALLLFAEDRGQRGFDGQALDPKNGCIRAKERIADVHRIGEAAGGLAHDRQKQGRSAQPAAEDDQPRIDHADACCNDGADIRSVTGDMTCSFGVTFLRQCKELGGIRWRRCVRCPPVRLDARKKGLVVR